MLKSGRKSYFLFLISILIITDLVILLDVPVLRQVFGFIFLTFVPGFLLLSLLKLNKLGLLEKIVLSVGLSVAFLMLFGLLVNGSLLAIGYTKPLSTTSLLVSFSMATIILAIIAYIRNRGITFSLSNLKLTTGEKAFLVVPALFPLLSIVGMRIMNLTDNNVILMLLLFLIPAYVIFISFSNRKVSEKVYPITILLISISLLLMYSLRSNHIIGSDTHRGYLIFLTTMDNLRWSQLGFGNLDVCLSTSLLPAIYQTFLNIDPEFLYKLLFSLIFSISPLVVYLLSKKYIGSFYAFLVSIFFMSQIVFQQTPAADRINIAILFFGLAILVFFHDGISGFSKKALFIVFAAAIIVSHYGTTYIAFFVLLLTWIGMQILSSIAFRKKELATLPAENPVIEGDPPNFSSQGGSPPRSSAIAYKATTLEPSQTQLRRGITITVIVLFLAMLLIWYGPMTGGYALSRGKAFIIQSFSPESFVVEPGGEAVEPGGEPVEPGGEAVTPEPQYGFFDLEIRDQPVQAAFGKTFPYTGVPQRIEFVFSWLTILFIAIGVLTTIRRFKAMVSTPYAGHEKPNFLLRKFEAEYLMLSMACIIPLVAIVVLPHVSKFYGATRTYFQMMVPLSIFFVIGGITVAKCLKSRPYWLILIILIPYFLCTTGAMCQIFGFPRAITLNSEGPIYNLYVSDEESDAAKWIKEYADEGITIYVNGFTADILLSQGRILYSQAVPLLIPTAHPSLIPRADPSLIPRYEASKPIDGYIYLRHLELGDDGLVAEYPGMFAEKGKIYSSSGSEVYK